MDGGRCGGRLRTCSRVSVAVRLMPVIRSGIHGSFVWVKIWSPTQSAFNPFVENVCGRNPQTTGKDGRRWWIMDDIHKGCDTLLGVGVMSFLSLGGWRCTTVDEYSSGILINDDKGSVERHTTRWLAQKVVFLSPALHRTVCPRSASDMMLPVLLHQHASAPLPHAVLELSDVDVYPSQYFNNVSVTFLTYSQITQLQLSLLKWIRFILLSSATNFNYLAGGEWSAPKMTNCYEGLCGCFFRAVLAKQESMTSFKTTNTSTGICADDFVFLLLTCTALLAENAPPERWIE